MPVMVYNSKLAGAVDTFDEIKNIMITTKLQKIIKCSEDI